MKFSRLWFVPGLLLGVLVLLVVLGPYLVPADKMADFLSQKVTATTGAEVKLGTARVRFWPRVHLALGAGTLAGKTGTGAVTNASWRSLDLDLALGPLLRSRLEVGTLDIRGLDLEGRSPGHTYALTSARVRGRDFQLPLQDDAGGDLAPASLFLPFDLDGESFVFDGMKFRDVRAEGVADSMSLDLQSVHGTLATGKVSGSAKVMWEQGSPLPVTFAAQVSAVPAAALLADLAPELGSRWEGDLDGEVSGKCLIQDGMLVPDSLDLDGRGISTAGVLHAGDWLEGITGYLGKRQDLKDIRYRQLDQSFAIRGGRCQVKLAIKGPDTDWSGSGWVGLDGTLDLGLLVTLPADFTPDLGGLTLLASSLKDKNGRMTLALKIQGQAAKPRVALDLDRTLKGAAGDPGSALGKGLGGLLDKWKVR